MQKYCLPIGCSSCAAFQQAYLSPIRQSNLSDSELNEYFGFVFLLHGKYTYNFVYIDLFLLIVGKMLLFVSFFLFNGLFDLLILQIWLLSHSSRVRQEAGGIRVTLKKNNDPQSCIFHRGFSFPVHEVWSKCPFYLAKVPDLHEKRAGFRRQKGRFWPTNESGSTIGQIRFVNQRPIDAEVSGLLPNVILRILKPRWRVHGADFFGRSMAICTNFFVSLHGSDT